LGIFWERKKIVFWPAKEGTYIREAKNPGVAIGQIVEYINHLLEYDKKILILGEMKPNKPMDQAYCPTPAHFIGLSHRTVDPNRVGVNIESAHCVLAGLDPADEMGYALWSGADEALFVSRYWAGFVKVVALGDGD